MGDFGVLVYGGFTKTKALFFNFLSALTAVAGAFIGFYFYRHIEGSVPALLAFTAGGFIYVAASDLIPELQHQKDTKRGNIAFVFFLGGLVFMWAARFLGH